MKTIKTVICSGILISAFLCLPTGYSNSAPRNGGGIVYNKSDCGGEGSYYNVRWYGFGGDGPGSACGSWSLNLDMRKKVWSNGDHNWSQEELGTWWAHVEHWAKDNARLICRQTVPFLIKQALGKNCKSTAAKFAAECTGEIGVETEGLAEPACVAGAAAILEQCKIEVQITMKFVNPVTKLACDKI